MARRKSDCLKWTLVIVLVLCNEYVYSRPQVDSTLAVPKGTEKPAEDVDKRYSYRQINVSLFQLPLESSLNIDTYYIGNATILGDDKKNFNGKITNSQSSIASKVNRRVSRVVKKKYKIRPNHSKRNESNSIKHTQSNKYPHTNDKFLFNKNNHKPVIKKVITKWTDSGKYDDLNTSNENDNSDEKDVTNFINTFGPNLPLSTENYESDDNYNNNNAYYTQYNDKRYTHMYEKPKPLYSEESQFYTNHYEVIKNPYITRPSYVFTTPTPTPVITNVGYPKPWPEINIQSTRRPVTKKPLNPTQSKKPYKPNQNLPQYPGTNFDVTTFPSTIGYTDRIVIRPEEYSASSDDCPTIFVTLNNTFQGQGKEACPDLNIAVNTNVVNKNVVVESEEDSDTTLIDVFGLPLDGSSSDEGLNDYTGSQENDEQAGSASVEGLDYSGYNAANSISDGESSESVNIASPSNALSTISRPGRPNESDDDVFSFSSVIDFFRPAISAFSWLAAINPLSFSAVSFLLTPLILLFAGTSGLAALFAPWGLSGREASESYFYRPRWEWDDYYKTWQLNSFPNSRMWQGETYRSTESYKINLLKPTVFYKVKEILKVITEIIRNKDPVKSIDENHRTKRKKREKLTYNYNN